MIDKPLLTEMIEATPTNAGNTEEYYYWQGKRQMLTRICAYWPCDTETLQALLLEVTLQHGKAVTGIGEAYWQGQKDAVRTVLAIALNDDSYLMQVKSSLFRVIGVDLAHNEDETVLVVQKDSETVFVITGDLVLGEMPEGSFEELKDEMLMSIARAFQIPSTKNERLKGIIGKCVFGPMNVVEVVRKDGTTTVFGDACDE